VLASGIDALREVCGDAAAYCDPHSAVNIGAAIRRILDDPELRARMREAGRERARAFTWDACADATGEVLLEAWERTVESKDARERRPAA
jgi:glycosyltransferase involved in cell wall biosynthesis